jgi:2-methylisocitrate lyase-like PEP mutase family enzyme
MRTAPWLDEFVLAPFVFDGLQARLAERAGAQAVYMTGFGTAAQHGVPDIGLIGRAEMAANAERIVTSVRVPVIADADTGYGNESGVARTVETYARIGVAALHLEDQVWPKRCGFFEGKEVVPRRELAAKIRAASDTAGDAGPLIIGRTDALAAHGWDEVVARADLMAEAGADLVFVDGLRTVADAEACMERCGHHPLVLNSFVNAGVAQRLGYRLMLGLRTMLDVHDAIATVMREFVATGGSDDDATESFARLVDTVGLAEADRARERWSGGA